MGDDSMNQVKALSLVEKEVMTEAVSNYVEFVDAFYTEVDTMKKRTEEAMRLEDKYEEGLDILDVLDTEISETIKSTGEELEKLVDSKFMKMNEISVKVNKTMKRSLRKIIDHIDNMNMCQRRLNFILAKVLKVYKTTLDDSLASAIEMTDYISELWRAKVRIVLSKSPYQVGRDIFLVIKKDNRLILVETIEEYLSYAAIQDRDEGASWRVEAVTAEKLEELKREYCNVIDKEESEEIEEAKEYIKMFDPKELMALAERNGYTLNRVTGDHYIYEHKTTHKIIVIPMHTIGKGLMLKIQKQIEANSK